MNKMMRVCIAIILISYIWSGCRTDIPIEPILEEKFLSISFNFEDGDDGFSTGFADLPETYINDGYQLQIGYCNRPPRDSKMSKGMILKGENNNKDIFLYTYRKIDESMGLEKNMNYEVKISFDLGTAVSKSAGEAGTSPGQKIYVKVGVVNREPVLKLNSERVYELNLDKGNHSLGGKDIVMMGNVEKSDDMSLDSTFEYKHFEYRTFVESNDKGECYVLIGYDSKHEGTNWHFVDNVVIELEGKSIELNNN